jgi:hypothetical protein
VYHTLHKDAYVLLSVWSPFDLYPVCVLCMNPLQDILSAHNTDNITRVSPQPNRQQDIPAPTHLQVRVQLRCNLESSGWRAAPCR